MYVTYVAHSTLPTPLYSRACQLKISFYFPVNTTVKFARFAHSDLAVPDFSAYRRDSTKNLKRKNTNTADRNSFTYLIVGGLFCIDEIEIEILHFAFMLNRYNCCDGLRCKGGSNPISCHNECIG